MEPKTQPVVLIVEDEVLVRFFAVEAFREQGFAVIEADSASAAVLIISKRKQPNILFTDVNMPGPMDGIALAEKLFALWPRMKIIVTSGLPLARTIGHFGGRFLIKPYSLTQLNHAVEAVMAD